MSQFKHLVNQIQAQFAKMCASGQLYEVQLPNKTVDGAVLTTGYQLWDTYLKAFRMGADPVFRHPDFTEHTCNNDRNFIKNYGNIVAIIDNKMVTMFDIKLSADSPYYEPMQALSTSLKQGRITNLFVESFNTLHSMNYQKTNKNLSSFRLGMEKALVQYDKEKSLGVVVPGKVYEFNFFHVDLPKAYVDFTNKSVEAIQGDTRTTRELFEKGLNIPLSTLELVRDLINQGSLRRGDMYLPKIVEFINLKKEFDTVLEENKNFWMWIKFKSIPFARFANELIGTTCIDLAKGEDINKVCREFNKRVDPANYMKAVAPVTPAMIKIAEQQIAELGYGESFDRRVATIDDINISDIKHVNSDKAVAKPAGLFASAGVPTAGTSHKMKDFDKVEEVTIDKFMSEILPTVNSVEVLLTNNMESNLVALFTSVKADTKNSFKWNNPFSWTYKGNLSGKSMIKENVKAAGGKISGVLRCSLQWNDEDTKGIIDFDLHCKSPFDTIYYSNKRCSKSKGWLDVDMINPSTVGVENITWQNALPDGDYKFYVRNFSGHKNHTGFKAEIEFDGNVFNYHCTQSFIRDVNVATVTVKKGVMSIEHHLPETTSSRKIWNLDTNQFHAVNLICTSPNYWGDNNIGTKEYFFMLQDCQADEPLRAFHPDQLNGELNTIRKSLDLLGNYKMVQPDKNMLAGVGFNNTEKTSVILRLKGSFNRVIKVNF